MLEHMDSLARFLILGYLFFCLIFSCAFLELVFEVARFLFERIKEVKIFGYVNSN